jgi:hypothetical protein
MGQISQIEDEEDRRNDSAHRDLIRLPATARRRPSLRTYGSSSPAWVAAEPSEIRLEELRKRAARMEKMQTAWRNEINPPRLENGYYVYEYHWDRVNSCPVIKRILKTVLLSEQPRSA